jgi:hypothetical protein
MRSSGAVNSRGFAGSCVEPVPSIGRDPGRAGLVRRGLGTPSSSRQVLSLHFSPTLCCIAGYVGACYVTLGRPFANGRSG